MPLNVCTNSIWHWPPLKITGNTMQYACPHCETELEWNPENPWRPFCSERCKNNDFIAWANEDNRLPGNSDFDDLLSGDLELG